MSDTTTIQGVPARDLRHNQKVDLDGREVVIDTVILSGDKVILEHSEGPNINTALVDADRMFTLL